MSNTFGNNGNPASGSGFFYDDSGNSQYWSIFSSFPGGTVTDVYVYVSGDGSNPSCKLCAWDNNALVYSSGAFNISSGTRAINGQAWQHFGGLSVAVTAGHDLKLGIWSAGNLVWTFGSSGVVYYQRSLSGGPTGAGSPTGTESTTKTLYAYVLYTPTGSGSTSIAHVERGGSMATGSVGVLRSGSWVQGPINVHRSGGWVQGT